MDVEELIKKVIGAGINVHRELGPGYVQSIYENAMTVELQALGIRCEQQKVIPILYRGAKVGEHRLDLLVEDCLIVENKAVSDFDPVFFVVVRSYLKAAGKRDTLIFNFASMPLTIKRVGSEDTHRYRARHNDTQ